MSAARKKSAVKPKPAWVRDGTITNFRDTQIDLRNRRSTIWITVKATDRAAEKTAARLLELLNGRGAR